MDQFCTNIVHGGLKMGKKYIIVLSIVLFQPIFACLDCYHGVLGMFMVVCASRKKQQGKRISKMKACSLCFGYFSREITNHVTTVSVRFLKFH